MDTNISWNLLAQQENGSSTEEECSKVTVTSLALLEETTTAVAGSGWFFFHRNVAFGPCRLGLRFGLKRLKQPQTYAGTSCHERIGLMHNKSAVRALSHADIA